MKQTKGKNLLKRGRALADALLGPNGRANTKADAERSTAELLKELNKRRICPICNSEVETFTRFNRRRRARCAPCGALERHRMTWLYLKNETPLFRKPTRLLHFAPEPFYEGRIDNYITIDQVKAIYDPKKPDEGIDIQRMPFEDESFDMIYCSHVLEHVPDDRLAMRELLRVLRPDGLAVILVPLRVDLAETYEDASITSPEERTKHFGQWDHLRFYGRDFPELLRSQGFAVDVVHYADSFSPADQIRYGIHPEPLFACRKTAS